MGKKFRRNRSIQNGFRDTRIFVFCTFEKNSKIQNGHHFWQVKYLLKLGKASLYRYPIGQKFCRNPTSKFLFYEENGFKKYSYQYCSICVPYEPIFPILCFLSKIRKLNMTPIFGEENIF